MDESDLELVKREVDEGGYMKISDRLLASALFLDHHSMNEYLKHLEKHADGIENGNKHSSRVTVSRPKIVDNNYYTDPAYSSFQFGTKAQELMNKVKDPYNYTNDNKLTILHIATAEGDIKTVKYLLEGRKLEGKNSDYINSLDSYHRSALDVAINNYKVPIAILLLQLGAKINNTNIGDVPISCWAAQYGNNELFKLIIEKDASLLNSYNSAGYNPLFLATKANKPSIVETILFNDYSMLEKKFDFGITALWKAAEKDYAKVASILIKYGSDVNTTSEYGISALNMAVSRGSFQATKILMFNNAKFNPKSYMSMDKYDNSLLHLCCIQDGLEDLYLFLIDNKEFEAQLNRSNKVGKNIYDLALEHNRSTILEEMIFNNKIEGISPATLYDDNGYHILAKDERTKELSKIYNSVDWEITIKEARAGIDINKTNKKGNTLLYELVVKPCYNQEELTQKIECIKKLIDYGVDISYTERSNGYTPLDLSRYSGQNYIKKILENIETTIGLSTEEEISQDEVIQVSGDIL